MSPVHLQSPLNISSGLNDIPLIETRIEDGKLLYEKRWFHRGQSVFVEGRDLPKFPASISAIGNDVVCIKTQFVVRRLFSGWPNVTKKINLIITLFFSFLDMGQEI